MAILVPIAIFWFLALLVWRAQELRLMASAMTEVAVRLAEPDKLAEQSVASLGQTIRRQVAAMNDAISRAIGRAGELEALVHNEVAALERSYSENELRVRGLISELASEREALTNNSERVSETLKGVGAQVARDISAASGSIDKKLAERGLQLTELLVARSNEAAEQVQKAQAKVAEHVPGLLDRLSQGADAPQSGHRGRGEESLRAGERGGRADQRARQDLEGAHRGADELRSPRASRRWRPPSDKARSLLDKTCEIAPRHSPRRSTQTAGGLDKTLKERTETFARPRSTRRAGARQDAARAHRTALHLDRSIRARCASRQDAGRARPGGHYLARRAAEGHRQPPSATTPRPWTRC